MVEVGVTVTVRPTVRVVVRDWIRFTGMVVVKIRVG